MPPKKSKKSESAKKQLDLAPDPSNPAINRAKIDLIRLLRRIGSDDDLAEGTSMSRQTLNRYLNMEKMPIHHLQSLAARLGTTPDSLMLATSYSQAEELVHELTPPKHWRVLEVLSSPNQAANGLTYSVAKLESTLIDKQFARGKFYYLAGVDRKNQALLQACLRRHAVVCERCNEAKRIARNRTVIPLGNDSAWWVLDYWMEGVPLESLIHPPQNLPHSVVKQLGTEILLGLDELHSYDTVMRELTPDKVLVSQDFQKCTLTDFEMAILTQGTVSVSGRWQDGSQYLAPENVKDSDYNRKPQIVKSRDIYSWAAIMVALFTGDPLADINQLSEHLPDSKLAEFLIGCRHPRVDLRPKVVADALEVWDKW